MKKHLSKIGRFTALVLVSLTPFAINAIADDFNKKQIEFVANDDLDKKSATAKSRSLKGSRNPYKY